MSDFDVFFDQCLNNGWANNREADDLICHLAYYDVAVKLIGIVKTTVSIEVFQCWLSVERRRMTVDKVDYCSVRIWASSVTVVMMWFYTNIVTCVPQANEVTYYYRVDIFPEGYTLSFYLTIYFVKPLLKLGDAHPFPWLYVVYVGVITIPWSDSDTGLDDICW